MSNLLFLGVFAHEEDILSATKATRALGYAIHDVYTPYAVHGLEEAMALRRSRLTWVCLAFALAGFSLALWAQYWIGAINWPLNVGGKPFNSLPAYLPVIFELTVLFAGLGVTFTMLARTRLFPGKKVELIHEQVTNDRFVLAVKETSAAFDPASMQQLWEKFNLVETKTYWMEA